MNTDAKCERVWPGSAQREAARRGWGSKAGGPTGQSPGLTQHSEHPQGKWQEQEERRWGRKDKIKCSLPAGDMSVCVKIPEFKSNSETCHRPLQPLASPSDPHGRGPAAPSMLAPTRPPSAAHRDARQGLHPDWHTFRTRWPGESARGSLACLPPPDR